MHLYFSPALKLMYIANVQMCVCMQTVKVLWCNLVNLLDNYVPTCHMFRLCDFLVTLVCIALLRCVRLCTYYAGNFTHIHILVQVYCIMMVAVYMYCFYLN